MFISENKNKSTNAQTISIKHAVFDNLKIFVKSKHEREAWK